MREREYAVDAYKTPLLKSMKSRKGEYIAIIIMKMKLL